MIKNNIIDFSNQCPNIKVHENSGIPGTCIADMDRRLGVFIAAKYRSVTYTPTVFEFVVYGKKCRTWQERDREKEIQEGLKKLGIGL